MKVQGYFFKKLPKTLKTARKQIQPSAKISSGKIQKVSHPQSNTPAKILRLATLYPVSIIRCQTEKLYVIN